MNTFHVVRTIIGYAIIVNEIVAVQIDGQYFNRVIEMDNVIAIDNSLFRRGPTSKLQCASICANNIQYGSFGFNSISKTCAIFNTSILTNGSQEQHWQYYTKDVDESYPAFYASLTQPVSAVNTVVFGNTYLNIGNNYDETTGHFISSHYGVYMFSWTLETSSALFISRLHVNDQEAGSVQACSSGTSSRDTSTKFVTLTLQEGDHVYVYLHIGNGTGLRSTFSGWRIKIHEKESAFDTINIQDSVGNAYIDLYGNNINYGVLFTNISGKAAVPWTGLYLFTVTVETVAIIQSVYLKVNDSTFDAIEADGRYSCLDASNIISMKWMEKGEEIGVMTRFSTKTKRATFSGYAVYFHETESQRYPYFKVKLENNFRGPGKIVFSDIFINEGTMYSEITGEATVFVSGVYLITWITMTIDDIETHAFTELIVNEEKKGESFSAATGCSSHDCRDYTTGVAVLHLSVGDKLYINLSEGLATSWGSMFSGVLILN